MAWADRVAVQRAVERDPEGVGRRLITAVESAIPTYASLPEPQRRETQAIASWAVRRLLEMWVDGTSFTDADRRRFHGIGVARAVDGRPLLAVLRAYRIAAVEATDLVLEAGGSSLEVDDVVALNRTLLTSIEDLSDSLLTGYTVTTEQLADDRDRSLAGLTHDLVSGRHVSRDALRDRTRQLGISLPDRLSLLVAAPARPGTPLTEGDVADLASHLVDARPAGTADPVVLHAHRDGVAVVLGPSLPDPSDEVRFRGWRACLLDDVETGQVPRSYRLALNAVRTAPREATSGRAVLGLPDALYLAVLSGDPPVAAADLPAPTLGVLLDRRNAHLLEGLRGHLEHGSASEAAAALGLHPQTVRHRLRRLVDLTGRDPSTAWDRLLLHTAVMTLAVQGDRERPPA